MQQRDAEEIIPVGKVEQQISARGRQQRAVSAHFYRGEPLKPQQILMQYYLSASGLQIGTPSYFFQEGHGDRFARARYGEFRVAQDGSALLTYLRDADDRRILP
nr:GDYXXLXY domain-containing protein [Serratia rubidaea]